MFHGNYWRSQNYYSLTGTNWQGLADFDTLIDTLPPTASVMALLDEFGVRRLSAGDDYDYLTDKADFELAWGRQHKVIPMKSQCPWDGNECANDDAWRVVA